MQACSVTFHHLLSDIHLPPSQFCICHSRLMYFQAHPNPNSQSQSKSSKLSNHDPKCTRSATCNQLGNCPEVRRSRKQPSLSLLNGIQALRAQPSVAVMPPRYELEKYEKLIQACDCRTTLLVQRQVTHTYKSQWSGPRLASFIQEQEESGHTVCKGKKAERTSWILRATTLGFIYTLDVLLSKLPRSVSVSSNDKVLTRCCY